jgi:hypothetical protein
MRGATLGLWTRGGGEQRTHVPWLVSSELRLGPRMLLSHASATRVLCLILCHVQRQPEGTGCSLGRVELGGSICRVRV